VLLPFADNALCAANVRYGSKSRHNTAGENVRFDMSIAQSSRSGIGPTKPPAERPISDQFQQKPTERSPLPSNQPLYHSRMTGWRSSPTGVKPRYSTVTMTACRHRAQRGFDARLHRSTWSLPIRTEQDRVR
jgi:hypothetical protein